MHKSEILENLVPKSPAPKKRKFVAIAEKEYAFISRLAKKLGVPRGKVVTALIDYYKISDDSE